VDGNYYAPEIMERSAGRTGHGAGRPVHYNTAEEIDRLISRLAALQG